MPELVPDDDPFIRSLRAAGVRMPPHGPRFRSPRIFAAIAIVFLLLFVLLPSLTSRLADWLWFREIGFERVFLTKIATQWVIGPLAGLVAFAVLYGNARYAMRGLVDDEHRVHGPVADIRDVAAAVGAHAVRAVRTLALPWAALLSLFVALSVASQWTTVLQAIYWTPFGQVDPIFGRDIGYYVFILPAI